MPDERTNALAAVVWWGISLGGLALFVGLCMQARANLLLSDIGVQGAGFFASFLLWRGKKEHMSTPSEAEERPGNSQEPEKKTLLFDDFQAPDGSVVIRNGRNEPRVVPSTRTAQPVLNAQSGNPLRDVQLLDFFDLDTEAGAGEADPRNEFHELLNKLLLVLRDALFTHSAVFFWVNTEKQQLVVEAMTTESAAFTEEKRLPIESDLVGQVARTGQPQLIGNMNPAAEGDLLHYYASPPGVRSAVAVPVFFKSTSGGIDPVGVLVADSKADDAFGPETVTLLGRFTKVISAMIQVYTDKYELILDSSLLASIRRLQDRMKSEMSEDTILEGLVDELRKLVGWDVLTVTMYAEQRSGWVVQRVVKNAETEYIPADHVVDDHGSIVGDAIANNHVVSIPDLSAERRCRYFQDEGLDALGSLLVVPVSSYRRCYGALTLDSRTPNGFSGREQEMVYRLVENAAAALEVLYVNDLMKEYLSTDPVTGLATRKHFLRALDEEVRRSADFRTELACVLMAVDRFEEHQTRFGREGGERMLVEIGQILKASSRSYDCIGRLDKDWIGILLVNQTASEGYLWAEKVRKQVAGHILAIDNRTFSVTVSAGVCGLTDEMEAKDLMAGASHVLTKAIENGGNLVRVYL
jgi:diguanylate cyclase (GGDEF)-like protein